MSRRESSLRDRKLNCYLCMQQSTKLRDFKVNGSMERCCADCIELTSVDGEITIPQGMKHCRDEGLKNTFKIRICLRCDKKFKSRNDNRICTSCKTSMRQSGYYDYQAFSVKT